MRITAFIIAAIVLSSALYASIAMSKQRQIPVLLGATTTAKAMFTLEASTRRVLYEKNADVRIPMASTTKIATAITVLENTTDLDTPFEIDPRAVGVEGTSIYLQKGEKLSVRELLLGMMLRSGNDASTALALHVSDSVAEFADLMNQLAVRAGATNTRFTNPHGLDHADIYGDSYTTARDLALITAYAMGNATFAEIVATREAKISGKEYPRVLRNKNRLLYGMEACVGVKTGFTKKAGRCFVGAVQSGGVTIINVVLNCGPMFEESAELMEAGLKELTMTRLVTEAQFIKTTCGTRAIGTEDFSYPTAKGDNIKITIADEKVNVEINENLVYTAPAHVV